MDYGKAIRTLRAVRSISQKELASAAGLDASYVSLLEHNRRSPSTDVVSCLATAFNIPVPLFNLLASESKDLKGISPNHASALAHELLALVVGAEENDDPDKN